MNPREFERSAGRQPRFRFERVVFQGSPLNPPPETGEHPVRDRSQIGEIAPLYGNEKLRKVSVDVGYEIGREALGLDDDDAKTYGALYADHAMTLFNPENREALEKGAKMTKEERDALPDDELGRTPAEQRLINFMLEIGRQGKVKFRHSL